MRCPKCGFHSFDYLDACKKCNTDLRSYKTNKGAAAVAAPPASPMASPAPPLAPAFEPPPLPPVPSPAAPFAIPVGINLEEPPPSLAAASTEPLSLDLDLDSVEETKVDLTMKGTDALTPPPPAPPAQKVPAFTLDFGAPPTAPAAAGGVPASTAPPLELVIPPPYAEPSPATSPFPAAGTMPAEALPWGKPATAADPLSLPRGGFWIRFAAQLIDGTILTFMVGIIVIIVLFAMSMKGISFLSQNPQIMAAKLMGLVTIVNVSTIILHLFYFTYFHGRRGQTPGKKLLKLKVIQTSGQDMTYGKSFIRYLGYIVNQLTLCIGYIWAAFDKNKQGLHDKIAGTYVVRLR